jgi:hypothetical protein
MNARRRSIGAKVAIMAVALIVCVLRLTDYCCELGLGFARNSEFTSNAKFVVDALGDGARIGQRPTNTIGMSHRSPTCIRAPTIASAVHFS